MELVGPAGWVKEDTETNQDLVPPIFMNRHKINDVHSHAALIFAARAESDMIDPQTEADKGVTCVWVNQEELDRMRESDVRLREEVYKYASTALKIVGS